jgi:hypothetical protein
MDEDKQALKEFVFGASVIFGIVIAFLLIVYFLVSKTVHVTTSLPTTEVVGQYKECDIIRWNSNNLADYNYFLYCDKN